MKRFPKDYTAGEISALIQGEFIGDPSHLIDNFADPSEANSSSLIFLEQEKFFSKAMASKAGLIICTQEFASRLGNSNLIIQEKPYFVIMMLISHILSEARSKLKYDVSPSSKLGDNTCLAPDVLVGNNVVIGANCQIGSHTIIGANCVIGDNCILGQDCYLYPNVNIYDDSVLEDRVILHAGVVIGSDGFGYLLQEGTQIKIPQVGNVIIHADVEIGSNTTIDRATIGSTIIGEGTKIDNLVQIGHNCIIGKHSILCSQVGLAGSTTIGDYVYLAGQVGVAGHLSIGDKAMVGAQSGVSHDLEPGGRYFGYPARDVNLMKRILAAEKNLPEMYKAYTKSKGDGHSHD